MELEGALGPARQAHGELGAFAHAALHGDAPARSLDNLPGDPQAQAEAAEVPRRDRALEPLKDAVLLGRLDSDAVIDHVEHGITAFASHLDFDGVASAVLDRVRQ